MPDLEKILSEIDIPGLPHNVFFGDVVYEPGGTYGPRRQSTYQLLFIHRGHAKVEIDEREHYLDEGQMALLKPGHQEFFQFAKEAKTRHRWCHFDWRLPDGVAQKIERLAFRAPLSKRMEHLCDLGLSLQHDPHALKPSLQHLAAAAFWEFVGTHERQLSSTSYATLPTAVARVQTYITQHYFDDLSLKKLSAVASVTPEHLSRLFRKHLDTAPIQYLWQVRVHQGALYLRHTGLAVEEIAYQCGFKTAAHFSRSTKAHYGLTPSQIRARYWQPS